MATLTTNSSMRSGAPGNCGADAGPLAPRPFPLLVSRPVLTKRDTESRPSARNAAVSSLMGSLIATIVSLMVTVLAADSNESWTWAPALTTLLGIVVCAAVAGTLRWLDRAHDTRALEKNTSAHWRAFAERAHACDDAIPEHEAYFAFGDVRAGRPVVVLMEANPLKDNDQRGFQAVEVNTYPLAKDADVQRISEMMAICAQVADEREQKAAQQLRDAQEQHEQEQRLGRLREQEQAERLQTLNADVAISQRAVGRSR